VMGALLRFEWRYHTRQASFYAAALLFLFFGFALMSNFGPDNVAVNSSYLVMEATGLVSLLALFAAAVFASNAVLRDVEHGMLEIVYSTPVGRLHYLLGRYAGTALATMSVTALSSVGMFAATLTPWIEPERLRAHDLVPYLWSLLVMMVPNVLFGTALLFAIAALTRSAVATYAGAVVVYFLYLAMAAMTNSPLMAASKPGAGGGTIGPLLDPFALSSFFEVTRYWSVAEKNDRFVALAGSLLANRILWLAFTAAIFAVVYRAFSFRVLRRSRRDRGAAKAAAVEARAVSAGPLHLAGQTRRPQVAPRWTAAYLSATRLEWRALVWNLPFLLLLLLWMALVGTEIFSDVFKGEFRTSLYPTTGLILRTLRQPVELFGTILLVYFSAELFWRQQRYGMASIVNATPVPGGVMIAAKWTALSGLMMSVIASGIAVGVLLQLSRGYVQLEPLIYLSMFYTAGVPLVLLAAAATLIHALSPGKYVGMVLMLVFVIGMRMAEGAGLGHPLLQFAGAPPVIYTGMAGFGPNLRPFGWMMLHWSLIALPLLMIASRLWRDVGAPLRLKLRHLFRSRAGVVPARRRWSAALLALLPAASGAWIFYNTNVLNDYVTRDESNDWRETYERTYRNLTGMPQPTVTDIDLALDFFPEERRYHVKGTNRLANKTRVPIRSFWVAVRREAGSVKVSVDGARLVQHDARYGMVHFELDRPLAPNTSTALHYDLDFARHGFEAEGQEDPILANGTFLIGFRVFPSFGYRRGYEMSDPNERARRGLPPRDAAAVQFDAFETSEEPRVNLNATLSTSAGQIAVGNGTLIRSWERDGRRYFHYRTESPIANVAAFGSARYAVAKRRAGGVEIELYYHPTHEENVERMLDAAATSIRTFEASFGPYPHRELRMAEVTLQNFGAYASPGALWFVENRAFLTDARDPSRPDMVTRRVVHEVAHQWWGHQLVATPGPGASFLVETLAKHSESMIIERLRGRAHLDEFLEMELDRYLSGRSRQETGGEAPLLRVDSQSYIYYAKGAVVMNAISSEIGESALNEALRGVLQESRPKPLDTLTHLRKVSSPGSYALVEEWLQKIVFHDLRLEAATTRRRADGKYELRLRIAAGKTHADERGVERAMPFAETIPIGVFRADRTELAVQRHSLQQGVQNVMLVVDERPDTVMIDPHVTRIDKNRADNTRRVELQ